MTTARRKRTTWRVVIQVLLWSAVLVFLVWNLFPIYWLIATSLKENREIMRLPPTFAFVPTLENYVTAFSRGDFPNYFRNSLVIATSTTVLSLVIGSAAAYSFARFRFRFRGPLLIGVLASRMVPPMALLVPLFFILRSVGLQGTHLGLVIAHTTFALPLVVWVMTSFFREIPVELEQAAMIDGCSRLGVLGRIVVPLAKPGLAAVGILSMIQSWNEFMFALVLTAGVNRTLPAGIATFIDEFTVSYGPLTAAATVIMLPVLILGFVIQKQLVRGLTMGAVNQ